MLVLLADITDPRDPHHDDFDRRRGTVGSVDLDHRWHVGSPEQRGRSSARPEVHSDSASAGNRADGGRCGWSRSRAPDTERLSSGNVVASDRPSCKLGDYPARVQPCGGRCGGRRGRSRACRRRLATVVLVEGVSDQIAVEALAALRNRDLASGGVCVVPIRGAMGVARFLRLFGMRGLAVNVRGLCDEAEEGHFRRGLEQAGFGQGLNRSAMESLGFYVCVSDLEDELIRALDVLGVEGLRTAEEDLARFWLFQNPARPARAGGRAAAAPLHGHDQRSQGSVCPHARPRPRPGPPPTPAGSLARQRLAQPLNALVHA
jgi:hypothetical protein